MAFINNHNLEIIQFIVKFLGSVKIISDNQNTNRTEMLVLVSGSLLPPSTFTNNGMSGSTLVILFCLR